MNAHAPEPKPGEATPAPADAIVTPTEPAKKKRRPGRVLLMVSVPALLVVAGGYFYLTGGRFEETDNAYVQQAKVAISADVAGRITEVAVSENMAVHAGDPIFTIDAEPYEIALEQANAALGTARVNVEQLKVAYATAEKALTAAKDVLAIQQSTFDRQDNLVKQGIASTATLDTPKLSLQQAENAVSTAQQQVNNAAAALGGSADIATDDHPAVKTALAQVSLAERNLSKTKVLAVTDGVISQVASLNVGQFIAAGTTIASLVETRASWVEANFKETQLSGIHVGMHAEVMVDAIPGRAIEGTVTSIGAATGSEFSLIPAQNATGNWVKVTQRVPVRVDFDDEVSAELLRSGMSALVSVDTGANTLERMTGAAKPL
jgi:membrane fusion protein (multidrug efflux system)